MVVVNTDLVVVVVVDVDVDDDDFVVLLLLLWILFSIVHADDDAVVDDGSE